jgi:spore maturation protein SpmB
MATETNTAMNTFVQDARIGLSVAAAVAPALTMFMPGAAAFGPIAEALLPFLQNALAAIQADTGGNPLAVAVDMIQHLTPGEPNAAALAPK